MKSNQDKQLKQSIGGDIQIQINIDKTFTTVLGRNKWNLSDPEEMTSKHKIAAQQFDEGQHGVKSLLSCAAWGEHFRKKIIRLSRGHRGLMLMRQTVAILMKLAGDYQQEACSTWP